MAKQKAFVLSIKGLILALLGLADRRTPIISWAAAAAHCQQLPLNRAHRRLPGSGELQPLYWWHCNADPGASHTQWQLSWPVPPMPQTVKGKLGPRRTWTGAGKKIGVIHCQVSSQNQLWEGFVSAARLILGASSRYRSPPEEKPSPCPAWCWLAQVPHSLLRADPVGNSPRNRNPEAKIRALNSATHKQNNVIKEQ